MGGACGMRNREGKCIQGSIVLLNEMDCLELLGVDWRMS
jgi:hypothetical protein